MMKTKLVSVLALLPLVAICASCGEIKPSPDNQRKFRDQKEINTIDQVLVNGEHAGRRCPSKGNTRVLVIPVEFTDYPAETYVDEGGITRYGIGTFWNSETNGSKPVKHYKEGSSTEPAGSGRSKADSLEDIRKVYFGKPEETTWHSLRSYYQSASYGNQNFEGLVAPWQQAFVNSETYKWCSAAEFTAGHESDNGQVVSFISDLIYRMYRSGYKQFKDEHGDQMFSNGTEFLKYFDSDQDGCLDVVEVVYSAPFYASGEDGKPLSNETFWAFCGGTGSTGNRNEPELSKWAWQSYYTTVEGGTFNSDGSWRAWTCEEIANGTAKPDGHTIVHETGHAQGLDDYYDYDYSLSPAAGVDMMDHNVGDHNAHSKALLGWTNPIVVTNPTTVTLRSFTDTGDSVMVPMRGFLDSHKDTGNTLYQEYISLEYYTPTGVNKADSENAYCGVYPKCPTEAGVKVYHVDSRLGLFDYTSGSGKFTGYSDTVVSTGSNVYVRCAHSNTKYGSTKGGTPTCVKDEYQLEYLPKAKSEIKVTNASLFKQGDTFGYGDDAYKSFKFHKDNDGKVQSWGYKFVIDKMTADSVTITFYQA